MFGLIGFIDQMPMKKNESGRFTLWKWQKKIIIQNQPKQLHLFTQKINK